MNMLIAIVLAIITVVSFAKTKETKAHGKSK